MQHPIPIRRHLVLPHPRRILLGGTLALLALAGHANPVQAAGAIVVTSASGKGSSDGGEIATLEAIKMGQEIESDEGATFSILMADNAIIQMCSGAALSFHGETDLGPRVIDLSKGGLKANVAPRPEDEPLEIHTPAAIATLLGTAVHLYVDPETGETVITSIEHHVRVESHDPDVAGSVVLAPGEQVRIKVGKRPGRILRIDPLVFSRSSDCLDDEDFRLAALYAERERFLDELRGPIIIGDIPTGPITAAVSSGAASHIPTVAGIDYQNSCLPGAICGEGLSGSVGDIPVIVDPIPPTGPPRP
jgi:ferric-dicitrate binding protein FerR (iron transport regulator)